MTDSVSPAVRTRFAPSPTGLLHIGNARTAVFAWLLARHHGGQFLLRVEDTDRNRLVPEALQVMIDTLHWLGIEYDEGPDKEGPYGPYVQSERLHLYREHAERLLAEGKAYRCYCTPERLAELRAEQERARVPTGYDRRCRYLTADERASHEAAGDPHVVRFATPLEGTTSLEDMLRGTLTYDNERVGDFVLLKSDGYPVYHFAVVIDDRLMKISHVIRGPEYLSTGARDTLLHHAFGWEQPLYVHGSEIQGSDRSRLAKRHGAAAVIEFREEGILPEALLNFLALLGAAYSADREIFSKDELVALFDVDKLHPAPAIFDRTKLEWMNGQYINHILSLSDFAARCRPYWERAGMLCPDISDEHLKKIAALIKDRVKLLSEVVELTDFFFREPNPSSQELAGKKLSVPDSHRALQAACERLGAVEHWTIAETEAAMRALAQELGLKAGDLFMPLRVAITGKTKTPPLFETMEVLGRERSLARIERAAATLADA